MKEIKNIQASIRAKLKNKAKKIDRPFAEVLQYFGIERFLYRLSKSSYAKKFILKGALMLTTWQVSDRRVTLDIDFLARFDNQISSIEKVIKDVCNINVIDDGLVFDINTVKCQRIKEDADYEGVRVRFMGFLENSRIPMQIDVGFEDIIYPKEKFIDYPVILDFPKPHLKGYPMVSILSEKFEAAIKLGELTSRMKDFYDMWIIIRQFEFKGKQLVKSLKSTFNHRMTEFPQSKKLFVEEIYDETSDRQMLWQAFLKKGNLRYAPEKLSAVTKKLDEFFIEPVGAINRGEEFKKVWEIEGTWK